MTSFRVSHALASVVFALLGTSLIACGGAAEEKDLVSDDALNGVGGGAPTEAPCTKQECGPQPMMATQICPDGSTTGPTCARTKGICGWHFKSCPVPPPPSVCGPNACGPAPMLLQYCAGAPSPGPTCEPNANGTCAWQFHACPVPPPVPVCDATACGHNPFGAPNYVCKDGSIAGPVCEPTNGTCGWAIRSCP